MSQAPPAALLLARRVLVYETGTSQEPAALAEAADRADARLRSRLSELIGLTGYTALITRAGHLAQAELGIAQHSTKQVEGNGILHGVRDYVELAGLSSDHPDAAAVALEDILAHFIGLLITLIGADLASRLVYEAWPELAPEQTAAEGGT